MTKKRQQAILKNIQKRDAAIANNQKPIKRLGTKQERRFVRFGAQSEHTRQRDLQTIKKTANGVQVKIGGPLRGTLKNFTRRSSAKRAINKRHDDFLVSRLGKKVARKAKLTFKM